MVTNSEITLKRNLSLVHIVTMGLAWMSPMIFFTSFGVLHEGSNGMLLGAYTLAFIAILFTANSYSQMAKAFPVSGSAYTYVSKAISPFSGFMIGWVILLDYLFSCIVAVLMFGINLHAQFPSVPTYLWIMILTFIVMTINIIGIKTSANVNKIFVLLQILFIAAFCSLIVYQGLRDGFTSGWNPLNTSSGVPITTLLAGASLVCFSFLGFDSITTMAEETRNPKKNIPRAIFIIVISAGIMYFITSYLIQQMYPNFNFTHPDSAGYELMQYIGGPVLASIFTFVIIFSILAQGMASMSTVSRLLLVLGRSSYFPHKFAQLHPKYRTPVFSIIFVSSISLLSIFISLETAIMFVSFGALTAFLFVNISVIVHYFFRQKQRKLSDVLFRLTFPLIGACFVLYLITLLDLYTLLLGVSWMFIGLIIFNIKKIKLPFLSMIEEKVKTKSTQ